MDKIIFEDLPSTNTPINANNLNQMQTNIENAINEDTGWVDLSDYVNTTYFAIRSGYTPMARKIKNIVYWSGEIYCHTDAGSNNVLILENVPKQFRPNSQVSKTGVPFCTSNVYNVFIDSYGSVYIAQSSNVTGQYDWQGFQLSNLNGYIVD